MEVSGSMVYTNMYVNNATKEYVRYVIIMWTLVSIMYERNVELKKKFVSRFVITAKFLAADCRCAGNISEFTDQGVEKKPMP